MIDTEEEYEGYVIARYRAGYGVWIKEEYKDGGQSLEDFRTGKDARIWCDDNNINIWRKV